MNPNTVFSASLVTSLVLWFPSMQACLRGDLDLAPAGLRYLAALLVSRLALGGIARLVNAYRAVGESEASAGSGASRPPTDHRTAGVHNDLAAPPQRRREDPPDNLEASNDPAGLAA